MNDFIAYICERALVAVRLATAFMAASPVVVMVKWIAIQSELAAMV